MLLGYSPPSLSALYQLSNGLPFIDPSKHNSGVRVASCGQTNSCVPNCAPRIVVANGQKRIVIYSKRAIELHEELTYDYCYNIEQEDRHDAKIHCNCGARFCRGTLT